MFQIKVEEIGILEFSQSRGICSWERRKNKKDSSIRKKERDSSRIIGYENSLKISKFKQIEIEKTETKKVKKRYDMVEFH